MARGTSLNFPKHLQGPAAQPGHCCFCADRAYDAGRSTSGIFMATVLVTGGSGFVGAHCIIALLNAGHTVRTTIRNLKREEEVRNMLREGGVEPGENVTFFAADLNSDAGWKEAVTDCEYVLHVASPFPPGPPKHEDDLIIPAREGALRVLRAARDAGVKRVVLTSSFAAIGYGHPQLSRPFDENDWTDPNDSHTSPYAKSKRWRNAQPGISSSAKAARWSWPWSIPSASSARHWDRIPRRPSSSSNG
jgi:UDP-glucose 4-epimerase